jgi:cytoskeletal protein CcmA (bactofilin family)
MWGNRRKKKVTQIDSLIGNDTIITGNIRFNGGLHVDGRVKGNISAAEDSGSVLTLSEQGVIEGEVRVPNVILNGKVIGNVYVAENVELAINARIFGNVYYNLIEMAMGAEVNGSLIHSGDMSKPPLPLGHDIKAKTEDKKAGSDNNNKDVEA